ncbi:hypothetical protein [Microbacterium gorillae]|uniref:hypothetical protein n=1 Tax=Microbacterium gorillae TaxID=1231063 RepID=UPI003D99EAC8
MTTTDHSGEQLTRRQLRELRLTGQTPVVADESAVEDSAPADPVPPRRDAPVNNPLPRAAEPIIVAAPDTPARPAAHAAEHRLTRRELRDLERVRTASVPVVRPAGDDTSSVAEDVAPAVETAVPAAEEPVAAVDEQQESAALEAGQEPAADADHAEAAEDVEPTPDASVGAESSAVAEPSAQTESSADGVASSDADDAPTNAVETDRTSADHLQPAVPAAEESRPAWAPPAEAVTPPPTFEAPAKLKTAEKHRVEQGAATDGPVLNAAFGAQVAPGVTSGEQSFDELISRDSGGSTAAGHSLVLPDSALPPLTAPVTSTGAMLVTGTFNLPELGSQGHAPGVADGKDVDAVLIDGELPAASSPTPIAATAAVSQAKAPGEIIKPPVPEKSNKLMLVLAITAGVLALALVGVIVGAALTGMMQ